MSVPWLTSRPLPYPERAVSTRAESAPIISVSCLDSASLKMRLSAFHGPHLSGQVAMIWSSCSRSYAPPDSHSPETSSWSKRRSGAWPLATSSFKDSTR